jgi:hypothetical protein
MIAGVSLTFSVLGGTAVAVVHRLWFGLAMSVHYLVGVMLPVI